MRRTGERVDRNRRFLPLKLVDCPYPRLRQTLLNFEDLRIVRRDYQDVVATDGMLFPIAVNPGRSLLQDVVYQGCDNVGLLGRAVLIALVLDGQEAESRAPGNAAGIDALTRRLLLRFKLALIEEL